MEKGNRTIRIKGKNGNCQFFCLLGVYFSSSHFKLLLTFFVFIFVFVF